MRTDKKFDCVKMMRDIRERISNEIKDMSNEEILDYIQKGRTEYEKKSAKDSTLQKT